MQLNAPDELSSAPPAAVETLLRERAAALRATPEEDPDEWERIGEQRLIAHLDEMTVESVRNDLNLEDHVHLAGLPGPARLPRTPYHSDASLEGLEPLILHLLGLVRLLGMRSFSYRDENGGKILRHVAPRWRARSESSSHGWARPLSWHTDCAHRPFRWSSAIDMASIPEFIFWSAVRCDPDVPITYVRLDDVLECMAQDSISLLQEPIYAITSPESFGTPTKFHGCEVLSKDSNGRLICRMNRKNVNCSNKNGVIALKEFFSVIRRSRLKRVLKIDCGDIVGLNNFRTLHSRDSFIPKWDGDDRWLIRVYASSAEPIQRQFAHFRGRVLN